MAAKVGSRTPRAKKPNLTVHEGGAERPAAIPAADRKVTPKDNRPPKDSQASKDAAEQAQLISYLSKLGEQQRDVAAAKAVLDEKRGVMTETFRIAKAAGFERQELGALLKDMGTRSKDLVAAEIRRRKLRLMAGLPVGEEQLKLFESDTPTEAKDEVYWRAEGFQAYFRGEEAAPPADRGMPARFNQVWLQGWNDGQTAVAMSMRVVQDLEENGGGAHANANSTESGADDGIPPGYQVERHDGGDGYVTTDANDEEFGSLHATREAAIAACRADAETITRQKEAAAKAQGSPPAEPDVEDEV